MLVMDADCNDCTGLGLKTQTTNTLKTRLSEQAGGLRLCVRIKEGS